MIKKMLILAAVLSMLVMAACGAITLKINQETERMTPLKSGQVAAEVFCLRDDYANMYLVKAAAGRYIAIDAGISRDKVAAEMNKLKIRPDDVIAVLLTHSDKDHTGALALFKRAKVYLAAAEEQMVSNETARTPLTYNKLDSDHKLLADGQVLTLNGVKVETVLVPGHTPGSMCYILNEKYLFSGDALRIEDGKATLFNDVFNMDSRQAEDSLRKLARLQRPLSGVFTAHYGMSTDFQFLMMDYRNE